jgi:predicted metalloprotease
MRWQGRRESENVEDRRGRRGGPVMIGGGLGGLAVIVVLLLLGVNPQQILQFLQQNAPRGGPVQNAPLDPANDPQAELKQFVSVVLADTEDVWTDLFRKMQNRYEKPKLVLFTGRVQSACGFATDAVGPFYCPADQKVYLDLRFFDEMKSRLGAPGDFAQAYVIAHEVGHHVQNLMGITDQVDAQRRRLSKEEFNRLSVRLELQADFFAGVWAHHAQQMRNILEEGDIEEALGAATAIGDDRLQKQGQGYVVPDSFTHGTSAQRVRWLTNGLKSGKVKDGDTFSLDYNQL